MPIDAEVAQNAFLDNTLGPARGVATPATLNIALFMGDPRVDGVEVTGGSYARVAWDSDDWGPADEGQTQTTAEVTFPAASAAYPDTVTHWAGFDGTDRWLSGRVAAFDVTSAGPAPTCTPTLAFADVD